MLCYRFGFTYVSLLVLRLITLLWVMNDANNSRETNNMHTLLGKCTNLHIICGAVTAAKVWFIIANIVSCDNSNNQCCKAVSSVAITAVSVETAYKMGFLGSEVAYCPRSVTKSISFLSKWYLLMSPVSFSLTKMSVLCMSLSDRCFLAARHQLGHLRNSTIFWCRQECFPTVSFRGTKTKTLWDFFFGHLGAISYLETFSAYRPWGYTWGLNILMVRPHYTCITLTLGRTIQISTILCTPTSWTHSHFSRFKNLTCAFLMSLDCISFFYIQTMCF